MIYAVVMAGGLGTRLEVNCEKPLFLLDNKPLISYVLNNLSNSKYIDEIFVAISPNTPKTKDFIQSLDDSKTKLMDTSGDSYLDDLSFILESFENKSKNDTLLFINADLPFISSEIIDFVLEKYFASPKDSISTFVPTEIFKKWGLNYSYDFNGLVPSGLNVLRSENIIQDEEQLIISNIKLAININSLNDAIVASKLKDLQYFKYNEM